MTSQSDLHPQNVPGRFFVNRDCIGCDQCRVIAPNHFSGDDQSFAFVSRQPVTAEELKQCEEALGECPVTAIGMEAENPLAKNTLPEAEKR